MTSGGTLDLLNGAAYSNGSVGSGGIVEVGAGFTLTAATNYTSLGFTNGGVIKVDANGTTTNLVISSGTQEIVSASGVANATSVGSNGSLGLSGGTASGAVLSAGGTATG